MEKFTESDDSGKVGSRCWKKAKLVKYGELLTKAKKYASTKLPNSSKTSIDSCEISTKMDDMIDKNHSTNLTSSMKDFPTKFPKMKIENQDLTQLTMPSLQEHPAYYLLTIKLIEGTDLLIKDACGTSDPFVTFSYKGELLYKSKIILRSLNPLWNEEFDLILEGPFAPSSYLKVE
uniref:C2 domain-containing protein n=1 Tax=Romanomermis culicivorax TaxID=13658 RepID=A0A915JXG5_ROMCU